MPPESPIPASAPRASGRWVRRAESLRVDPGEVVGLVLAGGRSSRMRREKALIRVAGETLIERQLRTLASAGVRETFLSLRPDLLPLCANAIGGPLCADSAPSRTDHISFVPTSPIVLLDEEEGLGPLAGIVAAMARASDRHLLVLAVDMPGVRPSLLSHILSQASAGCGVAPRVGGMWEPLCAIYPPGSLDLAQRHLRSDSRSPGHLLDALAAINRVRVLPLSKDATLSLRSWNQPEDVG